MTRHHTSMTDPGRDNQEIRSVPWGSPGTVLAIPGDQIRRALDPVDATAANIRAAHDALLELSRQPACLVCRSLGHDCDRHARPPARRLPPRALVRNLLTTSAVAALCDVRPATVAAWAHAGKVTATRVRGRWLFTPTDVRLLILARLTKVL